MKKEADTNKQTKDLMQFFLEELQELELRGHIEFRQSIGGDLPPRLQQILDRTLTGNTPKEIARELNLSLHTIREHLRRLYDHYKVGNHRNLAAKFMR